MSTLFSLLEPKEKGRTLHHSVNKMQTTDACAGLKAARGEVGVARMLLSLDYEAANSGAEAALAIAGPCQAISLGIDVEPSTEPAGLLLLHNGEPIPQKPLVCCCAFTLQSQLQFTTLAITSARQLAWGLMCRLAPSLRASCCCTRGIQARSHWCAALQSHPPATAATPAPAANAFKEGAAAVCTSCLLHGRPDGLR